ncbi:helix-turn-helix domain-containing protein [Bacillus infantis]|uniref:helix-turn-helix domain-containing protein n=1 Tax=Bacillus infantis TaxID=324767 RepID=UPI003981A202
MITVREFANVLEKANIMLVGGRNNADKEIGYLSNLELTERTSRIKEKGFIMTTFHAFEDVKQIVSHLEWLQNIGVSAIGFHIAALKKIPFEVIEFCNINSLPLFEIPEDVPYFIIYEKYNQLVNQRENEDVTKIYKLNEKLMEIVLLEKDLNSIVKVIGEHINHIVCVLDPYFELIGYWKKKEQTRNEIRHLIELIIGQHKENVLKVRFTNRETNITVKQAGKTAVDFKIYPLYSKQNFLGYMIICQKGISDRYSEEVIKNGLRALSLAAYNKNTLLNYQKKKDIKLFESIFQGEAAGIDPSEFYIDLKRVTCILQMQSHYPEMLQSKLQMLAELLKENEANSRIWIYNGKIVAVLASDFDKETLTQILRDCSHVRIGVSALGAVGTIESIQILYSQSATALTHSKTHELQLSFWEEMGIEKVGYNLHSHHLFPHFDEEILGPLLSYDQKKNASLTETLYIYLKHFCSLQKASSELYIHPNTVKYRLQKINELLPLDIQNSTHYSLLVLAFSIYYSKQVKN